MSPNKSSVSSTRSSPDPTQKIRLPAFDDAQQLQTFEFFIKCTCSTSPVYYGSDFWSNRLLQLSLSEPAIRYALCSLGSLHRSVKTATANGSRAINDEFQTFSLHQYTNAISHTQVLLAESSTGSEDVIIKGLVACILFVCYENLLANYTVAQMHLQNGLKILARYAPIIEEGSALCVSIPQDIADVLSRLDLQAMSFAEARAPYPYHSWPDSLKFPTYPLSLTSVSDALSYLIKLVRWVSFLASFSEPNFMP